MSQSKKGGWLQRLGFALLMPVVLFLSGLLILSALGADSSDKIADTLQTLWLPLTVLRLIAYIIIAYFIVPIVLRRKRDKYHDKARYWQDCLAQCQDSEDEQGLQWEYDNARHKQHAFEQLLQHRYRLLLIFWLFEVVTIQLPFWLK